MQETLDAAEAAHEDYLNNKQAREIRMGRTRACTKRGEKRAMEYDGPEAEGH